jgi:DNA polymerase-3 subunit delta
VAGKISVQQFKSQLDSGQPNSVYLCLGGEPLLLDQVSKLAVELTDEMTRDFNLDQFHGDKLDAQSLAASLGALPMMSETRTILVKRADSISTTVKNYLNDYVKNPVPSSVLILMVDGDGKAAWIQKLSKASVVIDCSSLKGAALRKWIKDTAKGLNITVSEEALDLITENRNVRLIDVAGELLKASLLLDEGGELDMVTLQHVWGIETEVNIWSFFDHVASGKRLEALRELALMRESMEKDSGGFVYSQVARRWRLVRKEKEYDRRKVAFAGRKWSGNTKRQWQMASSDLKALPQDVAEKELDRMLNFDRDRKSKSMDAILAFERLIHYTSLDQKRRG